MDRCRRITPTGIARLWFAFQNRAAHPNRVTKLRAMVLRGLAQEAAAAARRIADPDLKLQVLLVAARYMVLAERAERELAQEPPREADDE